MDHYDIMLREAFPYVVEMLDEQVAIVAAVLAAPDENAPYGSSYAVTTRGVKGRMRRVWLSAASAERLRPMLKLFELIPESTHSDPGE